MHLEMDNDTHDEPPEFVPEGANKKDILVPRSSGLLRLFKSELFNAWMALQYLQRQDQIGVHYYLCNRLRDLPLVDIEFIVPQLCHLMITRRVSSTPLECLIMDLCRKYIHLSTQLLWLLESYLNDFSQSKDVIDVRVLKRVVRLLREVQRASFSKDSLRDMEAGRVATGNRRRRSFNDDHESPNRHGVDDMPSAFGTLFGFGLSLLTFGMPEACRCLRPLALMEARTPQYSEISTIMFPKDRKPILPGASGERSFQSPPLRTVLPTPFNTSSPSIEELHKGKAFDTLQNILERTAKQIESNLIRPPSRSRVPKAITLLYHAEMQFVTSLLEVSKRLCIVPSKESRQKALYAELNLINHNLPAAICLPFLCRHGQDHQHHRIVRIPSHEATILNSAERVPFLVFVEIVDGMSVEDLDKLKNVTGNDLSDIDSSLSISSVESYGNESVDDVQDLIEARTPIFPPTQLNDPIAEQMRLAAIMLAQLNRQASQPGANLEEINGIRSKLIHEIERLEKDEMIEALSKSGNNVVHDGDGKFSDSIAFNQPAVIRDDPSAAVFNEDWVRKKERIQVASPFGQIQGWNLLSVVVKSGVDMRQEKFACQLIHMIQEIWVEEEVDCWASPHHNILVASSDGGLIETIPNTISVHSIKKASFRRASNTVYTLKEFYLQKFGGESGDRYKFALLNFIKSLVGYSLITYVLQIKDRHNGNILIDSDGHIIHIDFGFMLSNAPGGNYVGGFETAPFKLTTDYIELLGNLAPGNPEFDMFRGLFISGLMAVKKHHERLLTLLECTLPHSTLPCLVGRETVVTQLKSRLFLASTDRHVEQSVDKLITSSAYNMFTRLYDSFQYYSNGIL